MPACCQPALLAKHCCFSWKALTTMACSWQKRQGLRQGERGELHQWCGFLFPNPVVRKPKKGFMWAKLCLDAKPHLDAKPLRVGGKPPAPGVCSGDGPWMVGFRSLQHQRGPCLALMVKQEEEAGSCSSRKIALAKKYLLLFQGCVSCCSQMLWRPLLLADRGSVTAKMCPQVSLFLSVLGFVTFNNF